MTAIAIHPAADLFPNMTTAEYADLLIDIKANGLIDDVVLDREGHIVDGRHRYRACQEADVTPRFSTLGPGVDVVSYVISKNLHRRHLSLAQRSFLAVKALPKYKEEAERRMKAGVNDPGPQRDQGRGRATQKAADAVGVSRNSVERAKAISERAPDLVEKVESGELTLTDAAELASLPPQLRIVPTPPKKAAMPKGMKASPKRSPLKTCERATAQICNAIELAASLQWKSLTAPEAASLRADLYAARTKLSRIIGKLEGAKSA